MSTSIALDVKEATTVYIHSVTDKQFETIGKSKEDITPPFESLHLNIGKIELVLFPLEKEVNTL